MPAAGSKLKFNDRDYIFNKKFYEEILVEKRKTTLTKDQCKALIEGVNKNISKCIVEENDGFKLPFGLGYLVAKRYEPVKDMIDWQKTRENNGTHVYFANLHTLGFACTVKWFRVGRISNSRIGDTYKFATYKTLRKAVSDAFRSGRKIYSEWSVSDFIEISRLENLYIKKYRKTKD